jgi:hypothetical protein
MTAPIVFLRSLAIIRRARQKGASKLTLVLRPCSKIDRLQIVFISQLALTQAIVSLIQQEY